MAILTEHAHTPRRVLLTGGCGFIGVNLARRLVRADPSLFLVNLDALTYAGNRASQADLERDYSERYRFVHGDICDGGLVGRLFAEHDFDTVINLAAESHVDRSIDGPAAFMQTNLLGTYTLLEAARAHWSGSAGRRFHHVSTDEVFGSLGPRGYFTETTPYDPSSPYSASKAGADHLVQAWHRTFGLPVTLSNCSNNYGPYQFPEKLIPLMIGKAIAGVPLPVYGDGQNVRDWIYVEDHCAAVEAIVRRGEDGRSYAVGGRCERTNLEVVHDICDLVDERMPGSTSRRALITFVTDRPGHDRRYAIDSTRIETELRWTQAESFETGLARTVDWYIEHADWVEHISSGAYRGERLGTGA